MSELDYTVLVSLIYELKIDILDLQIVLSFNWHSSQPHNLYDDDEVKAVKIRVALVIIVGRKTVIKTKLWRRVCRN